MKERVGLQKIILLSFPRKRESRATYQTLAFSPLDSRFRGNDKYISYALLFFLFLCVPACADDTPSLFLTPTEAAAQEPYQQSATRLDAVVYYRPGQWKVWINGQVYTPETKDAALTILSVGPETVRFKQTMGDKSREIALKPHQVYLWAEDKIVESGMEPPKASGASTTTPPAAR